MMVESVSSEDILRNLTPKPNPFQARSSNTQESISDFGGGTSVLYALSCTIFSQSLEDSPEFAKDNNIGITASFMPGDVSGRGMPDKAGGTNRRSSSHQTNQPRRPAQNASPLTHFPPENPLGPPQVPSPSYTPSSQYSQRSGFYGQYTMSTQPPMGMPPATPQYAYPHGYQSVPDNTMISQNIHASYQSMLPPAPVYPYQQPPDGQPMYTQQGSTSPSPPMSSTSSQNPTPPYPSHGQFHSLRYPSSISPSQYSYSFPTSPVYQSQYAPAPYPQHYTSPPEVDGQGVWWYLPHANPPSYPGHYHYSTVHQEMENTYPASSTVVPAPLPAYPMSPVRSSTLLTSADRPGSSVSSTSPSPVPHPSSSRSATGDRSIHAIRRPYHPNPPSHRSEWVMWAGNVPSDATHDELWRFFTQTEEPSAVLSIFLISRSSCAFVNYESDDYLQAAIAQFNGVPLRPHDSRCPRLVCRVRKIDDDLRAGVGGQRGVGMHSKWVKDQREKAKGKGKAAERFDQSDQDDSSSSNAALSASVSSDDESRPYFVKPTHSNSSGSYASTNSSLLSRHFPKRYFILKSLSQYDLDLSVEKNLWATQKHNEGILDQAYRTSNEIFLIFSVNKSGEFYGYAKMVGPVRQGEQRVSWATRTDSSSSSSSHSSVSLANRALVSDTIPEELGSPGNPPSSPPSAKFFPGRMVEASPLPVAPAQGRDVSKAPSILPSMGASALSAPAELGTQHRGLTVSSISTKYSLDHRRPAKPQSMKPIPLHDPTVEGFELDRSAPYRAVRTESGRQRLDEELSRLRLNSVEEIEEREEQRSSDEKGETWGESFKIEWICTERLPFYRTRHLRNPWNHDREVKVSRDGTELEPSVGEQLLEEWGKMIEEGGQQQGQVTDPASGGTGTDAKSPATRRPGPGFRTATTPGAKSTKDRESQSSRS